MSEHVAKIRWRRGTEDFRYETYDRSHTVTFGGGSTVQASSAPEFKGRAELANPEEMLVAALSSCHMLTFLAIAARKRLVVDEYDDDAVGFMTKNAAGKLYISRVILRPRVRFAGSVDAEHVRSIHELSHRECFIANSVLTKVEVEVAGGAT
jgi:organic hydroperoxide reductase OsmC/OhrA